ncbi:MAG: serine hydrolase [Planctomycetota bacterium]
MNHHPHPVSGVRTCCPCVRRAWLGTSRGLGVVLLLASSVLSRGAPAQAEGSSQRFERVRPMLRAAIAAEMQRGALPGFVIAVADGADVVWSAGFGFDDPARRTTLRGNSPFRVASISKLFTDTAVMRAVERGELDLDADVATYTPGIRPRGSPGGKITLRLLMQHAAGLVREPPVGHYFDLEPPPLAEVVGSLAATELVAAPGAGMKYSNAGLAWVGHVLATQAGESFESVVAREVLQPLGLARASFRGADAPYVVQGLMWTYDGRAIPTPRVDLGLGPAANLCASMQDLVRFAQTWFLGDQRPSFSLLREDTLRAMFTPGWPDAPIGLGFFLDELDGHRRVGHEGAYYGVASQVAALPTAGIAVAAATPVDFAAGPVQRIVDLAMRAVLAARRGTPGEVTLPALGAPLAAERARALAGTYRAGAGAVELLARADGLWLRPSSGLWRHLTQRDDAAGSLLVADRGTTFETLSASIAASGAGGPALRFHGTTYARSDAVPSPCPEGLRAYLGEYGWDHDTLLVFERDGHLSILIEWLAEYPLQVVDADRGDFVLAADRGMYRGEGVRFARTTDGAVASVTVGAVTFPRRPLLGVDGGVFRIQPRFPRERLLAMAQAARAPRPEPDARAFDLVELHDLDATFRYDVRYATADNFMGFALYDRPAAKLQRPAAEALVRVHRALASRGLGLVVHDAYRPWLVTKMFFDATPEAQRHFVANPERGSRHNRGCAVDVGLYDRATGETVSMPSGYDEFTPRAYPGYPGGTSRQRYMREVLRAAMEAEGFAVYEFEWWHFDYRDWQRYPVK